MVCFQKVGVSARAGHESPDGITIEFDGSPLSPKSGTEVCNVVISHYTCTCVVVIIGARCCWP